MTRPFSSPGRCCARVGRRAPLHAGRATELSASPASRVTPTRGRFLGLWPPRSNGAKEKRREGGVRPTCPSKSSVALLAAGRCRPRGRTLGIRCPFRVLSPPEYRSYWFSNPAMPLAVSSAVWSSQDRPHQPRLGSRQSPLFEFRLPPESCPAEPSRPAAAGQHLSWTFAPYSTSGDR